MTAAEVMEAAMAATTKAKLARRRKEYDFFMSGRLGFTLGILESGRVLPARQVRMPCQEQKFPAAIPKGRDQSLIMRPWFIFSKAEEDFLGL